jgi:hypothetical protein
MFPALGRARSAYDLQIAVLPSVVRMELRGIGFNRAAHEELLAQLRAEWARLEEAYVAACDVIGRPDLKRKIPTTPIAKQKLLRALLTVVVGMDPILAACRNRQRWPEGGQLLIDDARLDHDGDRRILECAT